MKRYNKIEYLCKLAKAGGSAGASLSSLIKTSQAESNNSLYHLSPNKFDRFEQQSLEGGYQADIGFHFGTKDTALTASHLLHHKGKVDRDGTMYLYEVDAGVGTPLFLGENRRGSWSASDIFRAIFESDGTNPLGWISDAELDDYYGDNDDEEEGIFLPSESGIPIEERLNLKDMYLSDEEKRNGIMRWLKEHGFDSIEYENTYEGGGRSFIVFDPSKIKIKSITEYKFADEE